MRESCIGPDVGPASKKWLRKKGSSFFGGFQTLALQPIPKRTPVSGTKFFEVGRGHFFCTFQFSKGSKRVITLTPTASEEKMGINV